MLMFLRESSLLKVRQLRCKIFYPKTDIISEITRKLTGNSDHSLNNVNESTI